MSWLTLLVPKSVVTQLARIADALERAYPVTEPNQPAVEEDVTYIDDDKIAKQQLRAQLEKMGFLPPADPLDDEMEEGEEHVR